MTPNQTTQEACVNEIFLQSYPYPISFFNYVRRGGCEYF